MSQVLGLGGPAGRVTPDELRLLWEDLGRSADSLVRALRIREQSALFIVHFPPRADEAVRAAMSNVKRARECALFFLSSFHVVISSGVVGSLGSSWSGSSGG